VHRFAFAAAPPRHTHTHTPSTSTPTTHHALITLQRFNKPADVVHGVIEVARKRYEGDHVAAFKGQKAAAKLLRAEIKKKSTGEAASPVGWMVPIVETMHRDLRRLAFWAYDEEEEAGAQDPDKWLQEALIEIGQAFQLCATTMDEFGGGALMLLNEMYNISFKASAFFQNVDASDKRLRHNFDGDDFNKYLERKFKRAHVIEYFYNSGRRSLFQAKYKDASATLSMAFNGCYKDAKSNKQRILLSLIPVRLRQGIRPTAALMRKYGMERFNGIADAVRDGNIKLLEEELQKGQAEFVRWGLYMVLKKLRIIATRNLFKKVYLLVLAETGKPIVAVEAFRVALNFQGEEASSDEVECIVANLIVNGYMKGYISHQLGKVVFSKTQAFPSLADVK
jgi:hypothetical protein